MTKTASSKHSNGDEGDRPSGSSPGTEDNTSYKRRRIALACTSCRSRKSRCNGAKPACGQCVQLGFECIYEQPANPQSQSSGRHGDGYEHRLKSVEDMLRILVNQQNTPQRQSSNRGDDAHVNVPDAQRIQSGSEVAVIEDDDVCLLETSEDTMDGLATIGEYNAKDSRFFGPSSNISLLSCISKMTSAAFFARAQSQHNAGNDRLVSQMPSPQGSVSIATPAALSHQNMCALPPAPQAMAMIEHYFSDTGMLFPFISKDSVMTRYRKARSTGFQGVKRSYLCLLNMVFAFATITNTSNTQSLERNIVESMIFFHRAQDLIAESRFRLADLELVQCLLLMSQFRQGTQRSDETWMLHGLAVHVATQIGLHCLQTPLNMNPHEHEVRKRTWFACAVLDTTLSTTLGRPPSIPGEFVTLELPLSMELDRISKSNAPVAMTDDEPAVGTSSLFIATITLYKIQTAIISRLYSNNLAPSIPTKLHTLAIEVPKFEADLDEWQTGLLPELKLKPWLSIANSDRPPVDAVFERLSVIIRLRYLHTKLLLHRVVLQSLCSSCLKMGSLKVGITTNFSTVICQQSLLTCIRSASEAIEIVHSMSVVPTRLGGWWFSIYYTFHAALVLVACLVYHFEFSADKGPVQPIWTSEDIQQAATNLLNGRQAIERVGQGTRSSIRISKTMSKLVELVANIAYSSNIDATPVQILLNNLLDSGRVQRTQEPVLDGTNTQNPQMPPADFYNFGTEWSNLWLQDESGIFNSLGGLDAGLNNFMAA